MDWASFTNLCSFLRSWAEQELYQSCDTTRKGAFSGVSVNVGESHNGHTKFPQFSEKVEVLVSFLNYSVGMGGPGQVVGDLDT